MEMATAYPVMRALPIILTALATSLLGWGKPLGFYSCLGFFIVFVGALLIPLNHFSDFKLSQYLNRNTFFILVVACGTTGYTIFDKQALAALEKFVPADISAPVRSLSYYSTRGLLLSATLWTISLILPPLRREIMQFKDPHMLKSGMLAGFFASLCYSLVLIAMNYVTNVSYVQVFRQLGLPIGMGLGVLILKEHCTLTKVLGVILILSVLVPNIIEDIQNRRKVAKRRAETAKLNAVKA